MALTVNKVLNALKRETRWVLWESRRRFRARFHGLSLHPIQKKTGRIKKSDVILVTCLRNELRRLPFFLDYYRKLGVDHFIIIDNDSTDGFREWIKQFDDCSVWHTKASYLKSDFGMQWCNDLLRRYGAGHLCVTVDPDEFLVYPYCATRSLKDLGQFLKDDYRIAMHVVMLDAYSDGPMHEEVYELGDDPFRVCPFFDRDGYIQRAGELWSTCVRGGPRMRIYNRESPDVSPALNKIPVVWWQKNFRYRSSTHDLYPIRLNLAHTHGDVSLSGCLFHFKFVASLIDKAKEEAVRNQHFSGGREYLQYRTTGSVSFYDEEISVRYEDPEQLIRLGLMCAGNWS
jgi:hypothetical protein